MEQSYYLKVYLETMKFEGAYSNDPNDRGGETYCGISRKHNPDWKGWILIDKRRDWIDFPKCLDKNFSIKLEVSSFYKKYWNQIKGDKISSFEVARELFDTGVNQGAKTAVKYLQQSLNLLNRQEKLYKNIKEDGLIGKKTISTLNLYLKNDSASMLVLWMNVFQGMRYVDIIRKDETQEKYARGWAKRISLTKTEIIKI